METVIKNYKGNIIQCESIKGFKEIFQIVRICKKIGIETLDDIALFVRMEVLEGETLCQALIRYEKEFDEARNEQQIRR